MNNNTSAVQLADLSFWYDPGRVILDAIDIAIAENEFIAIIGQNGSGKTSLLKIISGLLRPSCGTVFVNGIDTAAMGIAEIAGFIGFVMQESDNQLFETSVYDEVAFALKRRLPKQAIGRKVEEYLAALDLWDKQDMFPLALNRADRVKTVFAAVLAVDPGIIILDEPLAGQDMRGCRMIMDMIAGLHQQGYTIILVTHNVSIAAEYARRILVMKEGRVFMDGDPKSVFGREEELSGAGIVPPQITRLSARLRGRIPLADALSPAELATMLVSLK